MKKTAEQAEQMMRKHFKPKDYVTTNQSILSLLYAATEGWFPGTSRTKEEISEQQR